MGPIVMKRSTQWVLVAIVVIVALNAAIIAGRFRRPQAVVPLAPGNSAPAVSRDGDSIHRERSRKEIEQVSTESLDELMAGLAKKDVYFYPGTGRGERRGQRHFELVLANRRYDRVRRMLSELPREKRFKICQTMLDDSLGRHRSAILRIINSYEDPEAEKNDVSLISTLLGTCSATLLLAEFDERSAMVNALKRIDSLSAEIESRISESKNLPAGPISMIRSWLGPDSSYRLSVCACALKLNGLSAEFQDGGDLAWLAPNLEFREVALTQWDAEPGTFDLTHRLEGVPTDTSKDVRRYDVLDWNTMEASQPEKQKELTERFFKWVLSKVPGHG